MSPRLRLVVDASIAVKWLFQEDGSADAATLRDPDYSLTAPDLMPLEVGNVIWKKHRRGEISIEEGRQALSILRASPVRIESSNSQLEEAWEIAVALDRSVYDGVYLALAVASDARLVTADRRLRNAMAAGPLRDRVIGLQDL